MNWCPLLLKIIEYLYYASGISVAIGVIYSIFQYREYKKENSTKNERDVNTSTFDVLRLFYLNIYPKYDALSSVLNGNKYFFTFDKPIVKADDALYESAKEYLETIHISIQKDMKSLVVELQLFALNIDIGNGDYSFAKNVVQEKYLQVFETVCPVIINKFDLKVFMKSFELYNAWRLETHKKANEDSKKELDLAEKDVRKFGP